MKIKFILIILLLFGLFFNRADAGSFYNSRGFGELKYFSNAQAIGMGGSLVSMPDNFHINMVNPATLVFIPVTRLSGDFVHEAIWNKTDLGKGFVKYTNLNGVSFAIPIIREKLTTAFGIIPSSQYDYDYQITGATDDYGYAKIIRAAGGLNKISLGFGYAVTDYLSLGSYLNYNFGKLEQTWIVDYVSDLFWDSSDQLTRKMWGINYTAGVLVRPVSDLYIGASFAANYKLNIQDHTSNLVKKGSLLFDVDEYHAAKKKINMPEFLGFGATYILKKKFRMSSDFVYQPWNDFSRDNNSLIDYNDEYRFGIGIEILPASNILAKYHEKMSYRIGYYYHMLNYNEEGSDKVAEYGITAGLGFPYYGSFGRIDLAFRYGARGTLPNNPVSENIFQMFISISAGERWFYRGSN
jgi:hypothetical protein